jgi:hypothetical protein
VNGNLKRNTASNNFKNMKVKVDHSGSCAGYNFKVGEIVDLPENVVSALGSHAVPLGAKIEEKEAPAPKNRMVVKSKVVTK